MKNFFKYAMMIVAVVMSAVVISSCGKDDDDSNPNQESNVNTSIVGLWHSQKWDDGMYIILNVKADGTGYLIESGKSVRESDWFTCVVNGNAITVTYNDGDKQTITYKMNSDGKSAVIYGLDDNDMAVLTFYRQ